MVTTTAIAPSIETASPPRIPMSYDEYLAWYDGDAGRRGEWVDGEVIPFVTTSSRHQQLTTFLIAVLANYLDLRPVGRLFSQTFELRSREGAAREPDILVLLNEHLGRLERVRLRGAADLVVEIVSPDSVTRDGHDKRDEYAAAGVPEYWLIDPREGKERLEVLILGQNGSYDRSIADGEGKLRSTVLPGVWVEPGWLLLDELPSVVRLGTAMAAGATEDPQRGGIS